MEHTERGDAQSEWAPVSGAGCRVWHWVSLKGAAHVTVRYTATEQYKA